MKGQWSGMSTENSIIHGLPTRPIKYSRKGMNILQIALPPARGPKAQTTLFFQKFLYPSSLKYQPARLTVTISATAFLKKYATQKYTKIDQVRNGSLKNFAVTRRQSSSRTSF